MSSTSKMRWLCAGAASALLLAAGGALAQAPAPARAGAVEAALPGRLPTEVIPSHYAIAVTPNVDALTFTGQVTIDVDVRAATSTVVFNAADLTVSAATIDGKPAPFALDAAGETITLTSATPLRVGKHKVGVTYAGKIFQQAAGLFALDYTNPDGGKARALFTQFENSDARRFVPSWDEPGRKATFDLTVTHPANRMVVSNMPAKSSVAAAAGMKTTAFATSPKMSSYLLFLSLGDFDRFTRTAGGVEHGIIARKGPGEGQAQAALDESVTLLPWFNDYFGVNYPLPKLDHLAGPGSSQFFGAMENWGAIFYFERILLNDPRLTTPARAQGNYGTIAHEMAHQWFGNIVTMSWWDDLWLNEGFATWMASKVVQEFKPEWKGDVQAVGAREGAMNLDSRAGSHPVVQKIESVQQASQAFDAITYQKGSAVIRMLEGYVGETAFRDGVRRYMKKYQYQNTVSDQLWAELAAASGKPVTDIAHDFTLQTGVPLVQVANSRCEGGRTVATLTQGRFGVDAASKGATDWRVPITPRIGAGPLTAAIVNAKQGATVTLPGCGAMIVNGGQTGYFRTLYGQPELKGIAGGFAGLAAVDQVGVLSDVWQLGRAGYQSMGDYLTLASATPADADPLVQTQVVGSLLVLNDLEKGQPGAQAFAAYARSRVSPVVARLGWDAKPGEDVNTPSLRGAALQVAADLGDPAVLAEARKRAAALMANPTATVDPVTRVIALNIVGDNADQATWDMIRAQAKAATNPNEKSELYALLGSAKDPALAKQALALSLTDEVPVTESATILRVVATEHPAMAFDFYEANKAAIEGKLDTNSRIGYLPGILGGSSDPAIASRLTAYADKNVAAGDRRAYQTAVSAITYRASTRERLKDVDAWIKANPAR